MLSGLTTNTTTTVAQNAAEGYLSLVSIIKAHFAGGFAYNPDAEIGTKWIHNDVAFADAESGPSCEQSASWVAIVN